MKANMKAIAWNMGKANGTDDKPDLQRTARTIASTGADVAGLCEVMIDKEHPQKLSELLAQLTGSTWTSVFTPKHPGDEEGNLIITKHSLEPRPGVFLPHNRSVAMAIIHTPDGSFGFAATHLSSNDESDYEAKRLRQVTDLRTAVAVLPEPRIVVGDFNETASDDAVKKMLVDYSDAWADALKLKKAKSYADNPPGKNTRTRRHRIDYVFHSKLSGLEVVEADIPDLRDLSKTKVYKRLGTLDDKGVRPSDHNLVAVTFAVKAPVVIEPPAPPAIVYTDVQRLDALMNYPHFFKVDRSGAKPLYAAFPEMSGMWKENPREAVDDLIKGLPQ